jgi:diacylglycerol kinase family enzyme
VVAIEAGSRVKLVARGYGLRAGNVEEQKGVFTANGRTIEVEQLNGDGAGFNVDGELISDAHLKFTVEPDAFELVVGA